MCPCFCSSVSFRFVLSVQLSADVFHVGPFRLSRLSVCLFIGAFCFSCPARHILPVCLVDLGLRLPSLSIWPVFLSIHVLSCSPVLQSTYPFRLSHLLVPLFRHLFCPFYLVFLCIRILPLSYARQPYHPFRLPIWFI